MKKSSGVIIFIVAFWIVLLLPVMVYPLISNKLDHENHENRTLITWDDVSIADWKTFFPTVGGFIEDNIIYKNEATSAIAWIDEHVFFDLFSRSVLVGKDNWLFYKGENCIRDYRGGQTVTEDELTAYAEAARELDQAAKDHNIEVYFLVTPNKEMIYGDRYMPEKVKRVSDVSRAEQIVNYLSENADVNVIYPKAELSEVSGRQQVWLKYDTHWNVVGAYIASMRLLEAEGSSYVKNIDEISISENGTRSGDLANMLGQVQRFSDDVNFEISGYYDDVTVENMETIQQSNLNYSVYKADVNTGKTVLYIGDSFLGSMQQFMAKTADKSIFVHRDNYGALEKSLIAEEKPNIIVFQTAERFIDPYGAYMRRYAGIIRNELGEGN